MKLIIIYGPPAAGKLTVGTELAELTGYKLFHNHLSIDCVKPVLKFGTPGFWRAVGNVRYEMIAAAARENVDMIHTFCYEFGADDQHFSTLIASAENNGGEAHLVLLLCEDEERRARIGNDSRVRIGKLTDPDAVPTKIDLTTPFPGRETLVIDTTDIGPEDAALQIVRHYGLQTQPIALQAD
jgi:hypothetical protein